MSATVGWIGLGAMGGPMAACVARAGLEVHAYDIDAGRAGELPGVTAASSAAAAAREAGVLVLMVATADQVEAVFDDGVIDALRPGAVLMITATVGPAAIAPWVDRLAERDVALVDAPVSGGVARAAEGDLLVMVSGDDAAVERCRPVLDAIAREAPVVGATPGDGQKVKLVNQLLCGVHIAAAGEALAFAEALGLDAGACLDVIRHGAAASFMLEDRGARMVSGEFEPARSALDIFVKDMGLVQGAAGEAAFDAPLAAAAEQAYLAGREAGLGRLDDASVIRVQRRG
jgi:3-hydroxyisobutyrate dehydrogenase